MLNDVVASIVFDGFDEGQVFFFGAAEWEALYRGAFVESVTDAGAESEGFGFGVEDFGFLEIDSIVFGEIILEAVEVSVLDETY